MNIRIEREDRWHSFVWGVSLIAAGVMLMLHFTGRLPWGMWTQWWPAIVIFLGFVQTLTARSARKLGSGVTLMAIGAWLLVASNGWYGLDWQNSWPLSLVAIGLGTLVRAVTSPFMRSSRPAVDVEVDHDVLS